jgi:hypothetical protein
MLLGAGLEHLWHHSRAHRFFALACWSADRVGLTLCDLVVRLLLPEGAALTVAVDDTLFKRSGKKAFGAAWQHDGAAKGPTSVGFGTCFVVAGILVDLPFLSRPVCLPVLTRLWRLRHAGKIALAREMAERIAARYPQRTVHLAEIVRIWYGVLHTRTVRVVLVRDDEPRTADKDERGYGLPWSPPT